MVDVNKSREAALGEMVRTMIMEREKMRMRMKMKTKMKTAFIAARVSQSVCVSAIKYNTSVCVIQGKRHCYASTISFIPGRFSSFNPS